MIWSMVTQRYMSRIFCSYILHCNHVFGHICLPGSSSLAARTLPSNCGKLEREDSSSNTWEQYIHNSVVRFVDHPGVFLYSQLFLLSHATSCKQCFRKPYSTSWLIGDPDAKLARIEEFPYHILVHSIAGCVQQYRRVCAIRR